MRLICALVNCDTDSASGCTLIARAFAADGSFRYPAIETGGVCGCDCNNTTDNIFMYAAGPVAEQLLADVPPPTITEAVAEVESCIR